MTLRKKNCIVFFCWVSAPVQPQNLFFLSLQSFLTVVMIKSLFVTGSRQGGKLHLLG